MYVEVEVDGMWLSISFSLYVSVCMEHVVGSVLPLQSG